jgi:hypothetical protein
VKTEAQVEEERRLVQIEDEGIGVCGKGRDDKPIVGWHTDSYPFVCVLMMSDCKDMIGGETAIRKADGDIIKVRGPTKVSSRSRTRREFDTANFIRAVQ